jgi:hypothetical protein
MEDKEIDLDSQGFDKEMNKVNVKLSHAIHDAQSLHEII